MKILTIFLDYQRHTFTDQVFNHNKTNAGYDFTTHIVDRKGISAALNEGINYALSYDYDAVFTMANDILMPDMWLKKMVEYAEAIPESGTIGIHTVESIGNITQINGLPVQVWPVAFGNILIPKNTINKVGFFNTDFDPYGTQDSDYAYRVSNIGLINYYIPGLKAEHIGHDVGDGTPYRKMKDDSLQLAQSKANYWAQWYQANGFYLPYDQEEMIINKEQFWNE